MKTAVKKNSIPFIMLSLFFTTHIVCMQITGHNNLCELPSDIQLDIMHGLKLQEIAAITSTCLNFYPIFIDIENAKINKLDLIIKRLADKPEFNKKLSKNSFTNAITHSQDEETTKKLIANASNKNVSIINDLLTCCKYNTSYVTQDYIPCVISAIKGIQADSNLVDHTNLSLTNQYKYKKNQPYLVKILLHSNNLVGIDTPNNQGNTLLHIAAYSNSIKVAKPLINNRANIDMQNYSGNTPLMEATRGCSYDMVDILLSKGANPNIQNNKQETPLMFACYFDFEGNYVQRLIDNGANINLTNEDGETALEIASARNFQKVINIIQKKAADDAIVNRTAAQATKKPIDLFTDPSQTNIQSPHYDSNLTKEDFVNIILHHKHSNAALIQKLIQNASNENVLLMKDLLVCCGYNNQILLIDDQNKKTLPTENNIYDITSAFKGITPDGTFINHNNIFLALEKVSAENITFIIKILLSNNYCKINHSALNENQQTAIYLAEKKGYKDVVKILIQKANIDLNYID